MKRFLSIAIASALCTSVFAQTTGSSSDFTYRRGETIEESVLPATPQAASVSGYFSSAFSYSTGSAQIDISFYTLAGHELSIPIGLRYSGGSGIKLDEVGSREGYNRNSYWYNPWNQYDSRFLCADRFKRLQQIP